MTRFRAWQDGSAARLDVRRARASDSALMDPDGQVAAVFVDGWRALHAGYTDVRGYGPLRPRRRLDRGGRDRAGRAPRPAWSVDVTSSVYPLPNGGDAEDHRVGRRREPTAAGRRSSTGTGHSHTSVRTEEADGEEITVRDEDVKRDGTIDFETGRDAPPTAA